MMYKVHFWFIIAMTLASIVGHTYKKHQHERRSNKRIVDGYSPI